MVTNHNTPNVETLFPQKNEEICHATLKFLCEMIGNKRRNCVRNKELRRGPQHAKYHAMNPWLYKIGVFK